MILDTGSGVPGREGRPMALPSQAPWQSSSGGCRVCTQELNQPFGCLSFSPISIKPLVLAQQPRAHPSSVRGPWAGVVPPFQLQGTRSRGTKHPEFPRLLTAGWGLYLPATSTDLLAMLRVLEASHSLWALKGLNSPGKIKSQHGTGSGSGEHSHGSQITGEFPMCLCAAGGSCGS